MHSDCVAPAYRSASGTYFDFSWSGTEWTSTPKPVQNLGGPQTREGSGEDWWFGHCNYYEGGINTGTVGAGYASWPNCFWAGLGCGSAQPTSSGTFGPRPYELEKPNYRKGGTRGMVALMDENGDSDDLWIRYLLTGQIFNVIQSSDGNIVVAGVTYNSAWPDQLPMDNPEIRWNDKPISVVDMNTVGCNYFNGNFPGMGYLAKLNPEGRVLWCTMLSGAEYENAGAFHIGSSINDVVERNGEYWAVGRSGYLGGTTMVPFVTRVNSSGIRLGYELYSSGVATSTLPQNWPTDPAGWFLQVDSDPGTGKLLVTGFISTPVERAIAMVLEPGSAPFQPTWFRYTGNANDEVAMTGVHQGNSPHYTTGGDFITTNGVTRIVWPIISNYEIGYPSSGPHSATLFVHGFDPNGDLEWTTDLGEVRAYDLQSDICQTADGNLAVVSSKWAKGYSLNGQQFNYAALPQTAQACLDDNFSYEVNGFQVPWSTTTDLFNYWNTDPFVAKLEASTGMPLWAAQWDADPSTTFDCSYGDLRNQECVYKITEASDGGLVISGNTSHNFDDMYLTKIQPGCQSSFPFEPLALDASGKYTLTADETWDSDRNIYGTIVVRAGFTLTITNNATIRFADTEQLYWPTRIEVEAGGTLNMNDNSTLAAVEGCPNSMWDGIQVHGNEFASQVTGPAGLEQGAVSMKNSTIENARVGVLAANTFHLGNASTIASEFRSGGIINAADVTFRNNLYDVSFSPYENFFNHPVTQEPTVQNNRSSFVRCQFITEGALANAALVPKSHASLAMVRGILFSGCSFRNDLSVLRDYEFYADQGTGIHAINSTFSVVANCTSPNPTYPNPCPSQYQTRSSFEGLNRGILATTFDMSRTFGVSKADFANVNLGIRMEGIRDASITENTFTVASARPGDEVSTTYAMYSDQCTGYRIEQNTFASTTADITDRKVGLIIRNSGKEYNTFYNNSFDGLRMGSTIMGNNAGNKQETGLEVKCNDYGIDAKNAFDVALTGSEVTVQHMQGSAIFNPLDPIELRNPAGNRFSAHTDSDDPESDWYVSNGSNSVEYFHHTSTTADKTLPQYHDDSFLFPQDVGVSWPSKPVACPSNFGRTKSQLREMSGFANEELVDAKTAYDATKDNGDTYSLYAYVTNLANNSIQVRNALQSVAPKVSEEVWKASFERATPMQPWHITQALLSNSPLQSEVLKMVETYGLPTYYADMVYNGQSGEASLLSRMQSELAHFAGLKAESLYDLGNQSWLDSLDLGNSLDSLKLWHEGLPSDNSASTILGVLSAERKYAALQLLAQAEELASQDPAIYGVVKHFASTEQQGGWNGTSVDHSYLETLAAQRTVLGSAMAYSWLAALGTELPEEIILFPEETPKRASRQTSIPVEWPASSFLEAFPNPSNGPVYFTFEVPEDTERAELRLLDLSGRELLNMRLSAGPGVQLVDPEGWAAGIYIAELRLEGMASASTKVAIE